MTETAIVPTDQLLADKAAAIRALTKEDADDRLESIAKDIERLQAAAIFQVAKRLTEAHEIFLYRRDVGGFTGWVERRLMFSVATAYRLLDVHKRLGGSECFSELETFPREVLYLIAAPSTPDAAREEALARAEAGEQLNLADVQAIRAAYSPATIQAAATAIRAETFQARDDARKAEFERPVTVSLVTGLHHGDCRVRSAQIEDNSVDLILTDPIYDKPADYGDAAHIGKRILKPGGSLLAYCGQTYHQDAAIAACKPHLHHLWTLTVLHTGGSNLLNHIGVRCGCKHILWFVNGTNRADPSAIIHDPIIGGGREKDLHDWQQSVEEAKQLIEKLTSPDGLVVDFFAGSGTTLVAAKQLGRRWIGFEIDAATAEAASRRITEADDPAYDAERDFSESINVCYEAIIARKAAGGPDWTPPPVDATPRTCRQPRQRRPRPHRPAIATQNAAR
jgi:site-specific DNA-methyltransferase (adenine-specific)